MQMLTLKIQDNILDKVIHFLNNFSKDDVEIIETVQDISGANYINKLRDRHIKISKNIDIDKITNEVNNGLS